MGCQEDDFLCTAVQYGYDAYSRVAAEGDADRAI